jgi:hypothetical protein
MVSCLSGLKWEDIDCRTGRGQMMSVHRLVRDVGNMTSCPAGGGGGVRGGGDDAVSQEGEMTTYGSI